MLNVAAAESLLGFLIYGSAVSTREAVHHDNNICRDLGLMVQNFRHTPVAIRWLICEDVCEFGQLMEYRPTNDFSRFVEQNLRHTAFSFQTTIQHILAGDFRRTANGVLNWVIESSLSVQRRKGGGGRVEETHKRSYGSNRELMTSFQFCEWLFTSDTTNASRFHYELIWRWKRVSEAASFLGQTELLKNAVIEECESRLTSELSYLHFPVPPNSIIVVPFVGVRELRLGRQPNQTRFRLG